jgi:arylsulfatase A-like enzyme
MTRSIMKKTFAIVLACLLVALSALVVPARAQAKRPNIVVILADDMGYADMGAFGSEIRTPNLDALARDGVRFTNFYTHASCSPTRSMLLSGVDTHRNGLGNMDEWTAPNQRGVPSATRATSTTGHDAAAAAQGRGLPHLHGRQVAYGQGARPDPAARGFERDFSLLDGAGSYWDMTNFTAATPNRPSPRTAAT